MAVFQAALALLCSGATGFVDRGSYRIHYESMGAGTPIVAIPGGPGFSGRSLWSFGFEMRDSARVILFDQLGTGMSRMKDSSLPTSLSLKKTLADLEALRKKLGYTKWTVFGQSWGSIVAVAYAAAHPDRVSRLVLASNPGFRARDYPILTTNLMAKAGAEKFAEIVGRANEAKTPAEGAAIQVFGLVPYYFHNVELGQALAARATPELFDGQTFVGLYGEVDDRNFTWIRRDIRRWKGRALIIQGHQDPCGAAMAYEMEKFVPNSELRMIDGVGHFSFLEAPETFFASVRDFLGMPVAERHRYAMGPAVDVWRKTREAAGWPFGR